MLREDDRVELINGEIIRMSPIGKRHAAVVARLDRHFQQLGERAIVWVQNPIELDEYGEPQPDLTLLRPRDDFYEDAAPQPADVLLMIEVGDSTLTYDLNEKRQYYADHDIAELWIVDAVRKIIHACRDLRDGVYRTTFQVKGEDILAPLAFPAFDATVKQMIG